MIGHSTYRLVEECEIHDARFAGLSAACKQLDRFYFPTRYPNGLPGGVPYEFFDETHARAALAALDTVLSLVEELLPLASPSSGEDEATAAQSDLEE